MMALCVFTMYFGGGLIPTYVWMRQLKLIDSIWAVVLPGSLSVYNMIVMRTYFNTQIPEELREASMLDGCSDVRFLLSIVLPLSGAILAVIGLYYAVGMWNDYFNPMVYLTTRSKLPLPNFLREFDGQCAALADQSGSEQPGEHRKNGAARRFDEIFADHRFQCACNGHLSICAEIFCQGRV